MIQAHLQAIKQRTKRLLPKLKCAFHQNETLTNFCSCSKCLLPLCPTCIKIHTIEHVNMKTDPSYQNIYEMVMGLNADIKQFILTQTQQKLHQFKDEIFANIDNLKKSLIDEIEKYFTQLILSTQQKISQISYIQDLAKHKSELKKTILGLKRFQKQLNDENVTGKFIIRNLIKYEAKHMSEMLQKYDENCKKFLSQVNGNYCRFELKQSLKNDMMTFLGQSFKITINQIPSLQLKDTQKMLTISQKLQQFTTPQLTSKGQKQKSDIKNTLNKVMSKLTHPNNNNHSNNNNNNKRLFMNHSSQRKSLHISSSSFCQNQTSIVQQKDKENDHAYGRGLNSKTQSGSFNQRRSMSKGKGLSLIQPRQSITIDHQAHQPRSLTMTQQIRFSLAEIQNVSFDYDSIKASFQFTPQNMRNSMSNNNK